MFVPQQGGTEASDVEGESLRGIGTAMPRSAPNLLIHETSPYLRQHAYNPVDWRPWGAEALEKARAEDKPIFLSIGYAACHWCHVMERESFEDEETARLLNAGFIPVKVDREERRDEKVIAAWNALALAAFSEAGRVFSRIDYLEAAEKNGAFLFRELRGPGGRVLRSWKEGRALLNSYLEDYANLAHGFLALYRATFDSGWFAAARELGDAILVQASPGPCGG